ncbi:MAG: autotransporter domain-containing protein [Alphaproteobacteria bacterium]
MPPRWCLRFLSAPPAALATFAVAVLAGAMGKGAPAVAFEVPVRAGEENELKDFVFDGETDIRFVQRDEAGGETVLSGSVEQVTAPADTLRFAKGASAWRLRLEEGAPPPEDGGLLPNAVDELVLEDGVRLTLEGAEPRGDIFATTVAGEGTVELALEGELLWVPRDGAPAEIAPPTVVSGDASVAFAGESRFAAGLELRGEAARLEAAADVDVTGDLMGIGEIEARQVRAAGTVRPGDTTGEGTLTIDGPLKADRVRLAPAAQLVVEEEVWIEDRLAGGGGLEAGRTVIVGDLAPGDAGRTQTVKIDGDLVLEPSARTVVDVDPSGAQDRVEVTGDLALGGDLELDGGATDSEYVVFDHEGDRSGQFEEVVDGFKSVEAQVVYRDGEVAVRVPALSESTTLSAAGTRVAGAVEDVVGADNELLAGIAVAEDSEGILRELGGSALGVGTAAAGSGVGTTSAAMAGRMRGAAGGTAGADVEVAATVRDDARPPWVEALGRERTTETWLATFASSGHTDADANVEASAFDRRGFLLGVDHRFGGGLLGAAVGMSRVDSDIGDGVGEVDADQYDVALYGGWRPGSWRFDSAVGYAHVDAASRRRIPLRATHAQSHQTSNAFYAVGGVSRAFDMTRSTLVPFVEADVVHLRDAGFTETGDPQLSLEVAPHRVTTGTTGVGAEVRGRLEGPRAMAASPYLRAQWRRRWGDTATADRIAFIGGGEPFDVSRRVWDRDTAMVETGVELSTGTAVTLDAAYSGRFSADHREHGARLGLRLRF